MGTASMSARIGGMLAPQIVLLGDYSAPLPLLIFGIISLIGGCLGLLLPEPTGKPLPDTFDDMLPAGKVMYVFYWCIIILYRRSTVIFLYNG